MAYVFEVKFVDSDGASGVLYFRGDVQAICVADALRDQGYEVSVMSMECHDDSSVEECVESAKFMLG